MSERAFFPEEDGPIEEFSYDVSMDDRERLQVLMERHGASMQDMFEAALDIGLTYLLQMVEDPAPLLKVSKMKHAQEDRVWSPEELIVNQNWVELREN